jgi:hypothetical protein
MPGRLVIVVLILSTAVMLWGRERSPNAGSGPNIRLTASPGVSVPNVDELTKKLERTLRHPPGTKTYVRENEKWVEVKPSSVTKPLTAVVRSFNEKEGVAYVDLLMYTEYNMPLLQIWHFDGKAWSDSIDRGIFIR